MGASIDDLLDQAVAAVNRGDLDVAHTLAREVLVSDAGNPEARDVLLSEEPATGELRRLTIMFCDLVGSTALSARQDPERYRQILGRFKRVCRGSIEDRYDGHISKVKGDGLLAVFGYPSAHEDDVRRAVQAGLELTAAVRTLSEQVEREVGETLSARVAVHRGLVYLDTDEDDLYGLAANVAARLQELAPPGALVISEEVLELVEDRFVTEAQKVEKVKGLDRPLASWLVLGESRDRGQGRGADRPAWPTPLVGREAAMATLRAAWADRPGGVVLRGEAGIGKSRLAATLASEVEGRGARLVELAGDPLHRRTGFHPLRLLLEQGAGIDRTMGGPERLRLLLGHIESLVLPGAELVPLLAPVLAVDPSAGYTMAAADARKLHDDISTALWSYVVALVGAGGPTLLVAEDLHWFDGPSRDIVARLVRQRIDDVLVVTCCRPDVTPAGLGEVIDLEPLTPAEAETVVAAIDTSGRLGVARSEVVARADGIPLYVEELVRAALHVSSEDGIEVAIETDVPEALYEPLVARLHATPSRVGVASAAASIGRELDRELLAQVVDLDDAELTAAVADLTEALILEPAGSRDRYRFRHELLRAVAYEVQPPSIRQERHRRIAAALVAAGGTIDWLVLASHYERGERPGDALGCYAEAADEARRRGAIGEARIHLGRAIELVWAIPDPRARDRREVALRLRRGFLAVATEGNASPDAASDLERCLSLAMQLGSGDDAFPTLIALWGHYASRGDLARAYQVLDVLRTVLKEDREWFEPENDAGFGMLDWYAGRFDAALERLERAAAAAAARGHDRRVGAEWFLPNDPLTAIHTALALARFTTGDPAGAKRALATAETLAGDLAFPQGPFSRAYNLTYAAWIHRQLGELDEADRLAHEVLELAASHGFDFWTLAATTQRAEVEAARADDLAALAASLSGLVMTWQMIDTRVFLPAVLATLGATLAAAGDVAAAGQRLDEALSLADETGSQFCTAEVLRLKAALASSPTEVERGLLEALELAREQGAVVFQLRIGRDLHAVGAPDAAAVVEDALARFTPGASFPELDAARSLLNPPG